MPVEETTIMFNVPPYLPGWTQLCGITYGFSGSRSATGGRSWPYSDGAC